jgi:glycogen(starch) synthase
MNVAIVASAFHPSVGGVEELVRQLALEQRRRGWGTVVATNRWPRDLPEREIVQTIPVRRYAFRVGGGDVRRRLAALLLSGPELRKFCRDLKEEKIELLHVQCVSCSGPYAMGARRALGLPLVVTLQGELTMDADQVFQRKRRDREMYRAILARADAITACSSQTLREAEEFFGASLGHKSRVIYNGVRLEEFADATPYAWRRPYILAIGRQVRQKGFDTLLRAVARAGQTSHDLILAGDGPERTALQSLAGELGVGDTVHFLGAVDHQKAVALYAGCSFFVLPSRHEPFGIVNLEAMAAGKAVVATNVGGVPELVTADQTGLLVPPENIEAMHAAMVKLMNDDELRERMGQAGRKRAQGFSWRALADQYEQTYLQAMENYRSSGLRQVAPAATGA